MPGPSLKIANIADDVLVDATYNYGSIEIDKEGTQYTIRETLKEDMTIGEYKVLSGAIKEQTLAEGGKPRTVIDGTFEKDGETFAGKAILQNGKPVFTEGESGHEWHTKNVYTNKKFPLQDMPLGLNTILTQSSMQQGAIIVLYLHYC